MTELKAKLLLDTKELREELNDLEKQADRIIEKIKFIKEEEQVATATTTEVQGCSSGEKATGNLVSSPDKRNAQSEQNKSDLMAGFGNFTIDSENDQMTITLNVYSTEFGIDKYKTVLDEIRSSLEKKFQNY